MSVWTLLGSVWQHTLGLVWAGFSPGCATAICAIVALIFLVRAIKTHKWLGDPATSPAWPRVVFAVVLALITVPALSAAGCATGLRDKTVSLLDDDFQEHGVYRDVGAQALLPAIMVLRPKDHDRVDDVTYLLTAEAQLRALGDAAQAAATVMLWQVTQEDPTRAWAARQIFDRVRRLVEDKFGKYVELLGVLSADKNGKLTLDRASQQVGKHLFSSYLKPTITDLFNSARLLLLIVALGVPTVMFGLLQLFTRRAPLSPDVSTPKQS